MEASSTFSCVPDCASLENLSLQSVRDNIEHRFKQTPQNIYTWVGVVLLSINPYCPHNSLYDDETKWSYLVKTTVMPKTFSSTFDCSEAVEEDTLIPSTSSPSSSVQCTSSWKELQHNESTNLQKYPHIFAIGQECYSKVFHSKSHQNRKQQTIIVSGESGAGKTESCRYLVSYFTYASLHYRGNLMDTTNSQCQEKEIREPMKTIEAILISAGKVLEAFGSAKTTNNDNSSRFGKLTGIVFDRNGKIKSAHLKTYLLAKSRVTKVMQGEQNFTIFHSLVRDWKFLSSSPSNRSEFGYELKMKPQSEYFYLKNGISEISPIVIPDHLQLLLINDCLSHLGLNETQRQQIWKTLVAILELGNLRFHWNEEEERCEVENPDQLKLVCGLLNIGNENDLKIALIQQTIHDQRRCLSLDKVKENRDSTSRYIYEKLFQFLVHISNRALGCETISKDNQSEYHINILDIYGFEMEQINSFDQLCINYANECLQYLFLQHVILTEQELYQREGINSLFSDSNKSFLLDVENITNRTKSVINFLDGYHDEQGPSSIGIFQLLNDSANIPGSLNFNRDSKFVESVNNLRTKKFKKTQSSLLPRSMSIVHHNDCFIVCHSFSPVLYDGTDFVTQDRDGLTKDLQELLNQQLSPFISSLFNQDIDLTLSATSFVKSSSDCLGEENSSYTNGSCSKSIPSIDPSRRHRRRSSSIGISFSQSVRDLVAQLEQSSIRFVRCIKPNDRRIPFFFDKKKVESQLLYSGIPSVLHVMKSGYPCRVDIKLLMERVFSNHRKAALSNNKELNNRIVELRHRLSDRGIIEFIVSLSGGSSKDCQVGLTKVFFKRGIQPMIESLLESPPPLDEMEKKWKQRLRRRLKGIIHSITFTFFLLGYVRKIKAVTRVQSVWRTILVERQALERLNSLENLQMLLRCEMEKRKSIRMIVRNMMHWMHTRKMERARNARLKEIKDEVKQKEQDEILTNSKEFSMGSLSEQQSHKDKLEDEKQKEKEEIKILPISNTISVLNQQRTPCITSTIDSLHMAKPIKELQEIIQSQFTKDITNSAGVWIPKDILASQRMLPSTTMQYHNDGVAVSSSPPISPTTVLTRKDPFNTNENSELLPLPIKESMKQRQPRHGRSLSRTRCPPAADQNTTRHQRTTSRRRSQSRGPSKRDILQPSLSVNSEQEYTRRIGIQYLSQSATSSSNRSPSLPSTSTALNSHATHTPQQRSTNVKPPYPPQKRPSGRPPLPGTHHVPLYRPKTTSKEQNDFFAKQSPQKPARFQNIPAQNSFFQPFGKSNLHPGQNKNHKEQSQKRAVMARPPQINPRFFFQGNSSNRAASVPAKNEPGANTVIIGQFEKAKQLSDTAAWAPKFQQKHDYRYDQSALSKQHSKDVRPREHSHSKSRKGHPAHYQEKIEYKTSNNSFFKQRHHKQHGGEEEHCERGRSFNENSTPKQSKGRGFEPRSKSSLPDLRQSDQNWRTRLSSDDSGFMSTAVKTSRKLIIPQSVVSHIRKFEDSQIKVKHPEKENPSASDEREIKYLSCKLDSGCIDLNITSDYVLGSTKGYGVNLRSDTLSCLTSDNGGTNITLSSGQQTGETTSTESLLSDSNASDNKKDKDGRQDMEEISKEANSQPIKRGLINSLGRYLF